MLLITLLRQIHGAVTTAPNGKWRYPDDVGMAAIYEACCWDPVAGGFRDLIGTDPAT